MLSGIRQKPGCHSLLGRWRCHCSAWRQMYTESIVRDHSHSAGYCSYTCRWEWSAFVHCTVAMYQLSRLIFKVTSLINSHSLTLTRIIFLSQLLLFPVYTQVRQSVLSVNNYMKHLCAPLETVNFWTIWRHRGGFCRQPVDLVVQSPRRQLFGVHGVHWMDEGNKAYWRSVHIAVEKLMKK